MKPLPTVRIVSPVSDENPFGYIVINQSDYDHTKHATFVEHAPEAAEAPEPAPTKRKAKAAE